MNLHIDLREFAPLIEQTVDAAVRRLQDERATTKPDTILGYRYTVNQDMPEMSASAKSLLFGDFSTYIVRDVLGFQMIVFREKYADYLQVGFLGFSRHDGEQIDGGGSAIKHYANAAS